MTSRAQGSPAQRQGGTKINNMHAVLVRLVVACLGQHGDFLPTHVSMCSVCVAFPPSYPRPIKEKKIIPPPQMFLHPGCTDIIVLMLSACILLKYVLICIFRFFLSQKVFLAKVYFMCCVRGGRVMHTCARFTSGGVRDYCPLCTSRAALIK